MKKTWNILQNKKTKLIIRIFVVILALILVCAIYINDYYHADMEKIQTFNKDIIVEKSMLNDNVTVYESDSKEAGFIFYPGGKVEHLAYEPLMKLLAEKGIMCVLVEMPFNLAVLDIDAAEGIQEQFPEMEKWYIGGHSLGGSMAAAYLEENADKFEGLILLGSYSATDLSETGMNVLSIYGSEDKVLNKEKYIENKINLPTNFEEVVIDGGCHAGFGMYGKQEGDGVPSISNEEQILQATEKIAEFMDMNKLQ